MSNIEPSDIEAERHVIGSLLMNPGQVAGIMSLLNREDFYFKPYAWVYQAICTLSIDGKPVTPETVVSYLKDKHSSVGENVLQDVGGSQFVFDAMRGAYPDDAEFWCETVRRKSEERELLKFTDWAKRVIAEDDSPIEKVRAKIEEKFVSLGRPDRSNSVSLEVAADEIDARLERYINDPDGILGMETGWSIFDRAIDGFQPGNVYIFYAPSSRFKSLYTANIGWLLADRGYAGLWFTTEMPRVQVVERILQFETGHNIRWLRKSSKISYYRDEIVAAKERIKVLPIYFCDDSLLDIGSVRAEISRQKRWHNIDYVIIDLIDHVSSSRFKDELIANQSAVMAQIKAIAKEMNVAIILVSHVAKGDSALRAQADLDVENMKGSSSKYQDVDCAFSIMPVRIDPGTMKYVGLTREEIMEQVATTGVLTVLISLTKNRHGELVRIPFTLDFHKGGRFEPQEHPVITQAYMNIDEEE